MFAKAFALFSVIATASAACPNQCSGHGTCGAQEVCTCYDNWGMGGAPGGDCSDRFCPQELAWVDAPTSAGYVHQYAECAAKGVCDRETGECACLAGFTGKACARQVCPDDCSGHGTCEYMEELAYATVFNDYTSTLGVGAQRPTSVTAAWDSSRSRACVCDSAWSGINCASKICPFGNDYLATRADTSDSLLYQKQLITFFEADTTGAIVAARRRLAVDADHAAFKSKSFALTFTSRMGEKFTTIPIMISNTWNTASGSSTELAVAVKKALEGLPNRVIGNVNVVAADAQSSKALTIEIEFGGSTDVATQGKQNLLEVSTMACGAGCTPQITGIDSLVQWSGSAADFSSVTESIVADYNTYECGRRGKCDTDTGICACFEGFTGEACTAITALV